MRPLLVLCLIVSTASLSARAQDTIATDRPGLAFSPLVVPQGALQIELGLPHVTRTGFDSGTATGTSTLVGTPAVLRYGVVPRLEVRVGASLYNRSSVSLDGGGNAPDATTGVGDAEVGVKYQVIAGADGALPNLSLIGSVLLPTGASGFTAGDPVVTANAVAGLALPHGFGATLVAGATVPTASGSSVSATLVGLVGRSFTPTVSGYVEAGVFPTDGATPVLAGAGLAVLVTPTLQLDAFVDAGLTDDAPDLVGGIGVSVRFGR